MHTSLQNAVHVNPFGDQFRTFHFYPSESHKKVVHRITRGLKCSCGLILLTGEIGIGKTSVCRYIVQSSGDNYVFAESGNPFLTPAEQLYSFCKQFKLDTSTRHSISDLTDCLRQFFIRQVNDGIHPVIIIDESHLLADEHFSLLLVLSNMRLGAIPLVQIILVGQVEIMNRLKQPGVEALNQRIGIRCELFPLNKQETGNYIQFKLNHAHFHDVTIFDSNALERIWHVTGGLPRLINHISSHALDSIAFSGAQKVSLSLVNHVASDPMYQGLFTIRTKKRHQKLGLITAIIMLASSVLWAVSPLASGTFFPNNASATKTYSSNMVIPPPLSSEREADILGILPQMPAPPKIPNEVLNSNTAFLSDTVAKNADRVVAVKHDPHSSNTQTAVPIPLAVNRQREKREKPVTDQSLTSNGNTTLTPDTKNHVHRKSMDEISHPALETLQIGAIAWSENPESRMVVIGNQILHEGDMVGEFVLKKIEHDHLKFSLDGIEYTKAGRK